MNTRPFVEKLKIWLFVSLLIFISVYFIFRVFNYISGPRIDIISPSQGEIIREDTFIIEGVVKNAKNIYINGREILIDEDGNFKEELIAKSPYTLITIKAIDKYGKQKEEVINVGKE